MRPTRLVTYTTYGLDALYKGLDVGLTEYMGLDVMP